MAKQGFFQDQNPYNRPGFQFGGIDSRDFGVFLTDVASFGTPRRSMTFYSIPGRSGDLVQDNGHWENMEVVYRCVILYDFLENFYRFRTALLSLCGYQELTSSIEPDQYRMAILSEPIDPKALRKGTTASFDISFQCKPQRFVIHGKQSFQFSTPTTFYNPYAFPAKPQITLYGNGPGMLTVGNVSIDILDMDTMLILDSDTMNAYRKVGDSAPENQNSSIYALEFPELTPGKNIIHWSGGITGIEIVPRWWTI